jgi:hypothetical protein
MSVWCHFDCEAFSFYTHEAGVLLAVLAITIKRVVVREGCVGRRDPVPDLWTIKEETIVRRWLW